jgi:uncharacterized membrane protein (GlpM family)
MNFDNMKDEIMKINKKSLVITQAFTLVSIITFIVGIFVVKTFNDVENARYLLTLGAIILCEGVWAGVIFDCINRRSGKN